MNELRALLWLDWRLVRRDFAVLAAVALVSPPLLGLFAPANVLAVVLAFAFLPCTATLLGSTLAAGDEALPFLRARATSWPRLVALRLLHRCALASAVALVGALSAIGLSDAAGLVREHVTEPVFGWPAFLLVVIGLTAAGALVSAHARNPLLCVFVGWALYLVLAFGAAWVAAWTTTEWLGLDFEESTRGLQWALGWLGLLLAAVAVDRLSRRTGAAALRPWRFLAGGAAVAAVGVVLLVVPPVHRARAAIARLDDAWRDAGLQPDAPDAIDYPRAEALLEEAGIPVVGWWLHGDEGRAAIDALRLAGGMGAQSPWSVPTEELRRTFEPVNRWLDAWTGLVRRQDLDRPVRLALDRYLESTSDGLLLGRATLLDRAGDREEAAIAMEALWLQLSAGFAQHRLHRSESYRADEVRRQLDGFLDAVRHGLPVTERVVAGLRHLDPRDGLAGGVATDSEWSARPGLEFVQPRAARLEAERNLELARWVAAIVGEPTCAALVSPLGPDDQHGPRIVKRHAASVRLLFETELTVRVLDRRAGRSVDPASRCPDARWRLDEQADGSWSIVLENGPVDMRHDEPPRVTRVE